MRLQSSSDEKLDIDSSLFLFRVSIVPMGGTYLLLFLSLYQLYRIIAFLKINIENLVINL